MKKKIVLCGTLLKSVNAVSFSEKAAFLESVSFNSQMLGATNFGLVLGGALIFINKFIVKLFRIFFFCILIDSHDHYLGYVGKSMPCVLFQV